MRHDFYPDDMSSEMMGSCHRTHARLARRLHGDLSPADFVVSRHLDDPFVAAEIDSLAEQAEMLGIDFNDPEIMGAWLKDLIGKIKKKVQGVKEKKASISIDTGEGVAKIGPEGVNWTDPYQSIAPSGGSDVGSKINSLIKNPMVIAAGVGLVALLLLRKKKGGRR